MPDVCTYALADGVDKRCVAEVALVEVNPCTRRKLPCRRRAIDDDGVALWSFGMKAEYETGTDAAVATGNDDDFIFPVDVGLWCPVVGRAVVEVFQCTQKQ